MKAILPNDPSRDSDPSRDRQGAVLGHCKPTTPFDRLAAHYDQLWTRTPTGSAQRSLVWRNVDGLFHPGGRVLDIGCGTGADAAHFSARGIAVHATDSSPAMVDAARRRGGFSASVLRAEEIAEAGEIYDGAISNFGALNCVGDLSAVARALAPVVRPGGRVALCTIGRFCAWETLYYAGRFQFRKALRRLRGSASSSLGIAVHYPTVAALAAAFAPEFTLRQWMGIGLLVPPSYVPLPAALVRIFGLLDRALARLPLLRAMADHRLLILVRK
jgi:ubiquinone/menaquinone biosynthesis C-methylase UbiE